MKLIEGLVSLIDPAIDEEVSQINQASGAAPITISRVTLRHAFLEYFILLYG